MSSGCVRVSRPISNNINLFLVSFFALLFKVAFFLFYLITIKLLNSCVARSIYNAYDYLLISLRVCCAGSVVKGLFVTTQKNGVPNEVIKLLGFYGDLFCCPTLAIVRAFIAPCTAHRSLAPAVITRTVRDVVQFFGTDLVFRGVGIASK